MNLFQGANAAATFLVISALVAGLAKQAPDVQGSYSTYLWTQKAIVLLGLFIVLFRIKTALDDHRHFAEAAQDKNVFRYIGFILAVLSWIFWALAAYLLTNTLRSSELMTTSLLISTSWIIVHLIEILVDRERRKNELTTSLMREKWVLINIGYILCLGAHIGWFRPLIEPGALKPLVALLALWLCDALTSRTFKNILAAS
jgi:hypothetical protein